VTNTRWILERAAFMSGGYDRNAKDEVLFNLTDRFHLCGLIERAASMPKSGATRRRRVGDAAEAKAAFCRAHKVAHPDVWEWAEKRNAETVKEALLAAAEAAQ
jgi:hypothetical protein